MFLSAHPLGQVRVCYLLDLGICQDRARPRKSTRDRATFPSVPETVKYAHTTTQYKYTDVKHSAHMHEHTYDQRVLLRTCFQQSFVYSIHILAGMPDIIIEEMPSRERTSEFRTTAKSMQVSWMRDMNCETRFVCR